MIKEFNDIESLCEYRSAWRALLAQTQGATFFQSLEWLEAYWKHYGTEQKLRVLLVFTDDKVTGIVPLVVRSEMTRVGGIRFLTYPLDNWASFYGPIGPDPAGTLAASLEHIRHTPRDWDAVELRWVDPTQGADVATAGAMRRAGLSAVQSAWDQTSLVDLHGSWESYWAQRPSKWRNNYRRWQRRLAQVGEVTHLRYRPLGSAAGEDDPRWDLYDACEEIARRSWQGSSEDGTTLSHDSIRAYLRDTHQAAARAGALDLNLLLVGGEPVAFAYNYQYQGHVYGLRVGYDPAAGRLGAGNLLYARIIQDSFDRGDRLYDLGAGSFDCKRHFRTRLGSTWRYSYYHPAVIRGHVLRLKRWMDRWQSRRSA